MPPAPAVAYEIDIIDGRHALDTLRDALDALVERSPFSATTIEIERYQRDKGPMSAKEIEDLREGMLNPQDFNLSVDKEWTCQRRRKISPKGGVKLYHLI